MGCREDSEHIKEIVDLMATYNITEVKICKNGQVKWEWSTSHPLKKK